MNNVALQTMDLTSLKAVVAELRKKIIPSRIEKAQQPEPNTLQLGLRTLKGFQWIEISWDVEAPRLVEINSPIKSGSNSTLAKQIQSGLQHLAIVEINQEGFERIVKIGLAIRPQEDLKKFLVIELMGRHSNLFLMDQNQKIITLGRQIRSHQSRLRPLSTGDTYTPPPPLKGIPPNKNETFKRWKERLSLVPISLKKALQTNYQGISPSLAMQLASDKKETSKRILNLQVDKIEAGLWEEIFARWLLWLGRIEDENFALNFKGSTDYTLWGSEIPRNDLLEGISLRLGFYYKEHLNIRRINQIKVTLIQSLTKLKTDEESSLKQQEMRLKESNQIDVIKIKADSILSSKSPKKEQIQEAQKLYKKVKRLKRSTEKIKERISYHQQKLINIDESFTLLDNLLTSELEDTSQTVNRLIELRLELEEYLIKQKQTSKKIVFKNKRRLTPMEVKSSNGANIQIGRNHSQNEFISIKNARKGDLWFHAQECAGSHIVLKASIQIANDEDIQLAADLAALFSRAKRNKKVPIIMAPAERLQRVQSALPGTVRHRNGTIIWGESERALQHLGHK